MTAIINSNAAFSECGLYRWSLTRKISYKQNKLLFIGLNPSIAGKQLNDPTTNRIINFSKEWGYGRLLMINLFARITKDPVQLKNYPNPVGDKNDIEIFLRMQCWANDRSWHLWLGWGSKGKFMNRNQEVISLIRKFYIETFQRFKNVDGPLVVGLTKQGDPIHPLYVSSREKLKPFEIA